MESQTEDRRKMPEHEGHTAEVFLNNIMETISDNLPKQKKVSFFEEETTISAQMNKLFGRQRSVHKILGGGQSADVLLWRNKKISASVLTGATFIWVLFEWLNYNFLTLICFALVIGMIIQFVWANASVIVNRSPPQVPRLVLPDELFVNLAVSIGAEVNRFLGFLQDVSLGRNLKQFLVTTYIETCRESKSKGLLMTFNSTRHFMPSKAVASLLAAAVIGSWCNFLTVLYIGFVASHTLPVLYERYEDQVDSFVYSVLGELQRRYKKLDAGVLSKIPKGNLKAKKKD